MSRRRRDVEAVGTSRRNLLLGMRGGAVTSITTLAFNLALIPFVLDRLGPSVYGAWVALVAVMAVVALADTGIRTEVARRVAAAHGTRSREAVVATVHDGTMVICLLVAPVLVLGLVFTPQLAGLVFPDGVSGIPTGDLHLLMRGLFLNVALVLVLDAHFAVLRGMQRSDVEARAQQLALLVNAAITVGGILAGWSIWALFWAYLASTSAAALVQWRGVRRLVPELRLRSGSVRRSTVFSYLSLSSLAVFSQVGDVIDSQWDKVVLSRYVDQEAVAAFHVGTSLVLQGKVLAVLPLVPIMVAVAELRSSDPARAPLLQRKLMKIGAVASSVALGGLFVFSPAFIDIWLGDGYDDTGQVARLFTVAVAVNLVAAPVAMQAFAEGLHRLAAGAALVNMVVNAVLSLVLSIQIGLLGAVYGSIAGNVAGTAIFLVIVRRHLTYWTAPPWAALSLTALVSALMIGTGWDSRGSLPALVLASVGFAVLVGVAGAAAERLPLRPSAWRETDVPPDPSTLGGDR